MAANPKDTKMILDMLDSPVPQTLNEDGTYSVLANGDVSGINFRRTKLLRDHIGNVLPQQYFDVDKGRFVPGTIGGGGDVSKTDLLNLSSEVNGKVNQVAQQLAQNATELNGEIIYPLNTETFDGSNEAYHPDRLYFANGKFGYNHWLVHTPLPFERAPYVDRWECPSLLVSTDGINYRPHPTLPDPLVDLTAEQIARRDYFSDPSFTVNGNGNIEIWYRHTNGANTSDTNVYRLIFNGTTLSAPELVQESQNTTVKVVSSGGNFFRSQSVLYDASTGIYTAYYGTNEGVYKCQSTDPSSKVWTNLTKIAFSGTAVHPWHLSVKLIDNLYYAVAYFNTGGAERVEVYKSTDGLVFSFVRTLAIVGERYSNLRGLYQSTLIKIDGLWEAVVSVDLTSNPLLERRGLAVMRGKSVESMVFVDLNGTQKHRQTFLNGIYLPSNDKPNANQNAIIFERDTATGAIKQGFGVRKQLNGMVPTYYSANGVQNLLTAFIASSPPSNYPFSHIGGVHVDQSDENSIYFSTAKDKWLRYSTESHIKTGIKKVGLASTLAIDKKIYRLVIESAPNGVFDISTITGAVDGQEIILVNVLSATSFTVKNSEVTNGIRLRGRADKVLGKFDTLKLHYITSAWYEI